MSLSLLLSAVLLQGTQLDVQFVAPGDTRLQTRGYVVNGNPAPVVMAAIHLAQTLPDGRTRMVIRGSVYDPVASCTAGEPGPAQLQVCLPDRPPFTVGLTDGSSASSPFDPYRWEAGFEIDVTLARMLGEDALYLQCSPNVLGLTATHTVWLGSLITEFNINRPLLLLAASDPPKPDDSERLLVRISDPNSELTEFDSKLRVMNREWPIKKLKLGDGFYWYAVDENAKPAVFQTAQDGMLPGQIENVNGFLVAVAEKGGAPKKEVKAKVRFGFIIKTGNIDALLTATNITGFTKEKVEGTESFNYFDVDGSSMTTGDQSIKAEVLWRMMKARKSIWRVADQANVQRRIDYAEKAVEAAKGFKMKFHDRTLALNKAFWKHDNDFKGNGVEALRQSNGAYGAAKGLENMWHAVDGPKYQVGCWIGSFSCALRAASQVIPAATFENGLLIEGKSRPFAGTLTLPSSPTFIKFSGHLVQEAGGVQVWLPGDWGYILNEDVLSTGGYSHDTGYAGENIIYLGGCFETDPETFKANAKFWGLGPPPFEKTLDQWLEAVKAWKVDVEGHVNRNPTLYDRRVRVKIYYY